LPHKKSNKKKEQHSFDKVVKVIETLRGPNGCPWDKEQTRESIKPLLIEEAYEVLEAIEEKDPELIKEELGDLLLQVIFHAQIAKESNEFTIKEILDVLHDKMVRRHPHVFKGQDAKSSKEVLKQWEEIKKSENKEKKKKSLLGGIPKTLPALLYAQRIQDKASRVGFDWENISQVFAKFKEELSEFENAYAEGKKEKIEEEIGDLFFTLINISRFLKINPDDALKKTARKFISRFHFIEKKIGKTGKSIEKFSLDELDKLWEKAKEKEISGEL